MVSSISNTSYISQLFSKLDTKSQGYLEKSDLASAFSRIDTGGASSAADDVFSALDSDSDGKVTESEFSTTLAKLQDELDTQFGQMRMQGMGGHGGPQGMAGMPPPPQNDTGFSQDELQSQLDEIGSSDSERSSFISNIVNNFSAADSDGDGKVTFAEAQTYNQSSDSTGGTATTGDSAAASSEAQVMLKIMQLIHAYGGFDSRQADSSAGGLSVSA